MVLQFKKVRWFSERKEACQVIQVTNYPYWTLEQLSIYLFRQQKRGFSDSCQNGRQTEWSQIRYYLSSLNNSCLEGHTFQLAPSEQIPCNAALKNSLYRKKNRFQSSTWIYFNSTGSWTGLFHIIIFIFLFHIKCIQWLFFLKGFLTEMRRMIRFGFAFLS